MIATARDIANFLVGNLLRFAFECLIKLDHAKLVHQAPICSGEFGAQIYLAHCASRDPLINVELVLVAEQKPIAVAIINLLVQGTHHEISRLSPFASQWRTIQNWQGQ